MACGTLLVVLLVARRARAAAVLTASVVAGGVYTAWSVRGEMVDHLLFWLGGGVPALFVVAVNAGPDTAPRLRRAAVGAVALAFLACAGMAIRQLAAQPVRTSPDVSLASRALLDKLGRDLDRAVADVDDASWGEAAGIVAQLRREHHPIRVSPSLGFMYGRAAAAEDESGLVRVVIRREDTAGARRMTEAYGAPGIIAGVLQVWLVRPGGEPTR